MDFWRILHILSIVWLGIGLGATYPYVLRAWRSKDVQLQMFCLVEAANNETRWLLPGAMATGITGFIWAIQAQYNFIKDGWLAALVLLYIFFYFMCLPLFGFGLRRARLAALTAAHEGKVTDDLREVLEDRVPVVFGTALMISIPLLAWLAVFKPF